MIDTGQGLEKYCALWSWLSFKNSSWKTLPVKSWCDLVNVDCACWFGNVGCIQTGMHCREYTWLVSSEWPMKISDSHSVIRHSSNFAFLSSGSGHIFQSSDLIIVFVSLIHTFFSFSSTPVIHFFAVLFIFNQMLSIWLEFCPFQYYSFWKL